MVNFPIAISVTRRDASGVESRATHYEGSCNVSDMTEDASGETARSPRRISDLGIPHSLRRQM